MAHQRLDGASIEHFDALRNILKQLPLLTPERMRSHSRKHWNLTLHVYS